MSGLGAGRRALGRSDNLAKGPGISSTGAPSRLAAEKLREDAQFASPKKTTWIRRVGRHARTMTWTWRSRFAVRALGLQLRQQTLLGWATRLVEPMPLPLARGWPDFDAFFDSTGCVSGRRKF